jgi:hypothetical protein
MRAAILCGVSAAMALKPVSLPRRAWVSSAAAAAVAASPAHAFLGLGESGPPPKIDLSEAEVDALLGSYGATDVDVIYAPNGARLKLRENEVNEMQRLGFVFAPGRGPLELRTFTPTYWFPKEANEDWYSPFALRKLAFDFADTGATRRAKCVAVSDALRRRVDAKVAAVKDAAPPPGYAPPEPDDPTVCGRGAYRFKCADLEAPGAYQRLAAAERMKEFRAAARPVPEEPEAKRAFPTTGRALVEALSGGPALPAGWAAATDPATGKTFYGNAATGATQWDVPQ